jgi:hypothetical protein
MVGAQGELVSLSRLRIQASPEIGVAEPGQRGDDERRADALGPLDDADAGAVAGFRFRQVAALALRRCEIAEGGRMLHAALAGELRGEVDQLRGDLERFVVALLFHQSQVCLPGGVDRCLALRWVRIGPCGNFRLGSGRCRGRDYPGSACQWREARGQQGNERAAQSRQ